MELQAYSRQLTHWPRLSVLMEENALCILTVQHVVEEQTWSRSRHAKKSNMWCQWCAASVPCMCFSSLFPETERLVDSPDAVHCVAISCIDLAVTGWCMWDQRTAPGSFLCLLEWIQYDVCQVTFFLLMRVNDKDWSILNYSICKQIPLNTKTTNTCTVSSWQVLAWLLILSLC